MENKETRFLVTQSIRFPHTAVKVMYYVMLGCIALTLALGLYSLLFRTTGPLGIALILAVLSFLLFFFVSATSDQYFGRATVSFGEESIVFRSGDKSYRLDWDKIRVCGIEKTRRSFWLYCSDHSLSEKEKMEFPENVEKGVMYANYRLELYEEFMQYVPEKFKAPIEARKAELKIKDKPAGRK